MAIGSIIGGLTSLAGSLFGGGGGGYNTEVINPTLPQLPLQNELGSIAQQMLFANQPWLYNPWRPMDYMANIGVPQNFSPQYTGAGSLPPYPTGGTGYQTAGSAANPQALAALAQYGVVPQMDVGGQQAQTQASQPGVGGPSWNNFFSVPTPQTSTTQTGGGSSTPVSYPSPTAGQPTLRAGDQNPYNQQGYQIWGTPGLPSEQLSNSFLPSVYREPSVRGVQDSLNLANYASQAIPNVAAFNNAIYSPGPTPMEQQFLGAAADLGARQLANTHNRIEGQFENSASHSALAPALLDATNQYNQQLNQLAGQMGTQRQQTAAQMAPFSFGYPLQALQSGQQSAESLYGMGQAAQLAGLNFPFAFFGSQPFVPPTVVATPE